VIKSDQRRPQPVAAARHRILQRPSATQLERGIASSRRSALRIEMG
jgi:hypothetical protein